MTQKYFLEITYFHHIIHFPTLEAKIRNLYDDIEAGKPIEKGVALLLICILSNVCITWTPYEDAHCSFFDAATASRQAVSWIKAGMDLTDHCQRLATPTMEFVQAITILFFVIFLMEGISGRVGEMLSRAIYTARNLGFHTIDKAGNGWTVSRVKDMTPSEKEIARRIMWYLAATDW